MKKITAYIVGKITLGENLKEGNLELRAKKLMDEFPQIENVSVTTGEWDLMVKFTVKDMEEYYHTAWGIAKHLERGWGTLICKEFKR